MTSSDGAFGFVFNIQRYSLHDGPGIRTIVFLSGCPLSCSWCCNPESQRFGGDLMHNAKTCLRCGRCALACPQGAIEMAPEGPVVDREKCNLCGLCTDNCPPESMRISARRMSLDQVMDAVLADRPFYRRTGGGVTFSGGEPLVQADFVLASLRASKEAGVGTALETCGHVPWATLEGVLPWVDHLLYDVKQVDPEVHRAQTGVGNALILDNLRKAAPLARHIVIRVPIIPGFNDTPEAIGDIVRLAQSLDRVDEMHILPYHRMGQAKYDQLDRAYSLKGVLPPSEDQAREWAAWVEKSGLKCRVRG